MIEQPAFLGVAAAIGRLDAVGHGDRFVDRGEQLLVVDLELGDRGLGRDALATDPFLSLGEQFGRDPILVVGVEQLALLLLEAGEFGGCRGELWRARLLSNAAEVADGLVDALASGRAQLNRGVVLLDGRFDRCDAVVWLAALAFLLAAADEVLVQAAVAGRAAVDQAAAAVVADDGAAEVVLPARRSLTGSPVAAQHDLDLLKGRLVDELWVPALVSLAPVADTPNVERVSQQVGQALALDDLGRIARGRWRSQPAGLENGRQLALGIVAAGVELEGVADQWRPLGIEVNGADFAAVDQLADVAVTERCSVRRAAALGFFGRALEHFGRQVHRVELGDRGHDAVQQHAARGFVDVLRDGNELGARGLDLGQDGRIIGPLPGQPVDLVDDDVVDVADFESFQQGPESGALGRGTTGLAALDELVDDRRAETGRLAGAGVALRRQRQAFAIEVGLGLRH